MSHLSEQLGSKMASLSYNACYFIANLGICVNFGIQFAGFLLALAVALMAITTLLLKKGGKVQSGNNEMNTKIGVFMQENLTLIKVIFSFGIQETIVDKFKELLQQVKRVKTRIDTFNIIV